MSFRGTREGTKDRSGTFARRTCPFSCVLPADNFFNPLCHSQLVPHFKVAATMIDATQAGSATVTHRTTTAQVVELRGDAGGKRFDGIGVVNGDATNFNEKGARARAELVMQALPTAAPKLAAS